MNVGGVLADSPSIHFRAWSETFRSRGISFADSDLRRVFRKDQSVLFATILGPKADPDLVASIVKEKFKLFVELAAKHVDPMPGAEKFIKSLHESGFLLGIASGAPLAHLQLVLTQVKLKQYFPVIVSEMDIAAGKGSPDVLSVVVSRLGVEPARCVMIESDADGIAAAKRLGMKCILVAADGGNNGPAKADIGVKSLEQLSAADIKSLLK